MLKQDAYINGLGCISAQKTFENNNFVEEFKIFEGVNMLKCIEPLYKKFIDPMIARRMSRLVKMGIYSSKLCLEDANVETPDAIIVGTGLGCMEDTGKFLSSMIQNEEKLLNPTPFIQSTHNTVSSQIALFIKCHAYNITYSQRGLSFESALIDSLLTLKESANKNILLGGFDELTNTSFNITKRLGHWKNDNEICSFLESKTRGSIAGEGSSFFVLSDKKNDSTYAKIVSVETSVKLMNTEVLENEMISFLKKNNLNNTDIDLIMYGYNGDCEYDKLYHYLNNNLFKDNSSAYFKHLCGEYDTCTSFALWLSSLILKNHEIPEIVKITASKQKKRKTILIYKNYRNENHSFILLQSC